MMHVRVWDLSNSVHAKGFMLDRVEASIAKIAKKTEKNNEQSKEGEGKLDTSTSTAGRTIIMHSLNI